MEFKGTKGKWEVKHSERNSQWNVIGTLAGEKFKIARCPYTANSNIQLTERDRKEAKANAKLISCSPEVLEALKYSLRMFKRDNSDVDFEYLEQLIKKATEL